MRRGCAVRRCEAALPRAGSLINRFFGLYSMRIYSRDIYFVVLQSVFAPAAGSARFEVLRFDLKGARIGRGYGANV